MGTIIPIQTIDLLGYDPVTMYFNPRTVKFFSDKDKITSEDARESNPNINTEEKFHKAEKPNVIKFFLGNACNFRCSYCRQNIHEKLKVHDKTDIDNVVDTIRYVADMDKPLVIEFWGGEPLLYLDDMIRIADKLPKSTRYHIVTNGSLVDKHFYKWISKKNYEIVLSHDGPGQVNRTADPLSKKESRKYLIKLHKEKKNRNDFLINSVLTQENTDICSLVRYLVDQFDENIYISKIEPVIPYNEHASDVADKYNADMLNLEKQLFQGLLDLQSLNLIDNVRDISTSIRDFLCAHTNENFCVNLHEPKCGLSGYRSLCFDWNGIVYPCQVYGGTNIQLGKLNEGPDYPYADMPKSMNSMHCGNCPVVSLCRGVCPHLEDQYINSSCKNKYTLYMAILRFILFQQNRLIINDLSTRGNCICFD